jgi:hypothetical protein
VIFKYLLKTSKFRPLNNTITTAECHYKNTFLAEFTGKHAISSSEHSIRPLQPQNFFSVKKTRCGPPPTTNKTDFSKHSWTWRRLKHATAQWLVTFSFPDTATFHMMTATYRAAFLRCNALRISRGPDSSYYAGARRYHIAKRKQCRLLFAINGVEIQTRFKHVITSN